MQIHSVKDVFHWQLMEWNNPQDLIKWQESQKRFSYSGSIQIWEHE